MATKKPAYEAPAQATDKKKALETALRQIEKSFGKGAVMRMGDRPALNIEAIPTGSLALDAALGVGGVPKGRIIEIYLLSLIASKSFCVVKSFFFGLSSMCHNSPLFVYQS